jgi:hypothetical protein
MSAHDDGRPGGNGELDARLDAVFRGLPDSDELRDLKDELRASLAARAAELEASGFGPTAAASRALDELGDIEALAAEVTGEWSAASAGIDAQSGYDEAGHGAPADSGGATSLDTAADSADPAAARASTGSASTGSASGPRPRPASGHAIDDETDAATRARNLIELVQRHRVRPRPAFVVRTVIFAVIAAAGLALTALAAFGVLGWPVGASVTVTIVLLAAPAGVLVGDGAHQETTSNFPVPAGRAASYGGATFLAVGGLALVALFVADLSRVWLVAVGAPLVVVAAAWFSYLGATQTNRKKPWARRLQGQYHGTDRFSQDESAAARFGIYTVVIWIVAITAFVVLSFTVGFVWSWLALVAGIVVFFLVLARMLFPSDARAARPGTDRETDRPGTAGRTTRRDNDTER